MIYTHNGTLYSNKNEKTAVPYNGMNLKKIFTDKNHNRLYQTLLFL